MQRYAHPHVPLVPPASTCSVDDHSENLFSPPGLDSCSEYSPDMTDSRRESFATGPSLFSPKTEDWQSVDMQSLPSNHPFADPPDPSGYMRLGQDTTSHSHSHAFTTPSTTVWGMAAQATSLPQFDPAVAAGFEAPMSLYHNAVHAPMPFPTNLFGPVPNDTHRDATSPTKTEWPRPQPINQKSAMVDAGQMSAHGEMRRDSIRKRNARFEIPSDHNLTNIDQLIASSTNELEIKELKQQKRLLRNRQAALDSRQRKKQHTERLEDEKKQYTATIGELDLEINALRGQLNELRQENQMYIQYVDTLTMQKDEMIRNHTIESRELRKKVAVLTENINALESNSVPTPGPSGTAMNGPFGEMDSMCMPGAWDKTNMLHHYGMPPESLAKHAAPVAQAKKADAGSSGDKEKTVGQGGLLFLLFLVGAFVMSSPSPPAMPRVSDDVRCASAALLENVLKEANVPCAAAAPAQPPSLAPRASTTAADSWADMSSSTPMAGITADGMTPSMLGDVGAFLQPTREQTSEQAFSMTAAQYNGVHDGGFLQSESPRGRTAEPSQGRKNLAAALAEIRATNKQSGSADVYTRTLLWDQVPQDVVRDFIKMFAENNASQMDGQQQQQQQQRCNEIMS